MKHQHLDEVNQAARHHGIEGHIHHVGLATGDAKGLTRGHDRAVRSTEGTGTPGLCDVAMGKATFFQGFLSGTGHFFGSLARLAVARRTDAHG